MKSILSFLSVLALFVFAGCGNAQFEMAKAGDPERVLTGKVSFVAEDPLPPDAVLRIRIIDTTKPDLPVTVKEEEIHGLTTSPVEYRVEYHAEDALLTRGLNVEARIAFGGKMRFFNANAYNITINNFTRPLDIHVNRTR